ncbi:hypothetical protein FD44_GL001131 [Secundilactobacillus malefermentans DSM 5705 = KCTC 3548]|nr:hypothetical protein FD44_GL001131 [Secundilactobacillus malefermentans DSM 5705 = KCTC 3548]
MVLVDMRPWRNWQTRKIKDLVGIIPVEVRVFLAALRKGLNLNGSTLFSFLKLG